jgi:hypothetical protein
MAFPSIIIGQLTKYYLLFIHRRRLRFRYKMLFQQNEPICKRGVLTSGSIDSNTTIC